MNNHLSRSLLRMALFSSVVLGLITVVNAQTTNQSGLRADSTLVKKDTIAAAPTVNDSLLRERLAGLQKTIPLTYHKAVQTYVDLFTFRKPYVTKLMLERMPLFFPLYERMLAQYGLPDELKFLSIVESSLTPRAVSHAGAGGLWQIMPGTGRDLRLYQDEYVDERMDPVKATEAACKYFRDLYQIFGDWELSLAAYNCGPGAVKRAMRRSGGDSFYTIYDALPKETRGYVPQFVAFTYLMHYANDHGIFGEQFEEPIPMDTVHITGYFNLETFAKHSTMPLADLQKLNPAITTTILPEYTNRYPLRVPRDHYTYFARNRRAILDSAGRLPVAIPHMLLAHTEPIRYATDSVAVWVASGYNPLTNKSLEDVPLEALVTTAVKITDKSTKLSAQPAVAESTEEVDEEEQTVAMRQPRTQTYVVKKGDNLESVAILFNVKPKDLKRWNHLHSSAIQRGQKLVISKEITETHAEQLADQDVVKEAKKTATLAHVKRYKPRYHRVQDGDTLWNIVQRYGGLTIDQLKKINHIQSNSLKPGQKLIVG